MSVVFLPFLSTSAGSCKHKKQRGLKHISSAFEHQSTIHKSNESDLGLKHLDSEGRSLIVNSLHNLRGHVAKHAAAGIRPLLEGSNKTCSGKTRTYMSRVDHSELRHVEFPVFGAKATACLAVLSALHPTISSFLFATTHLFELVKNIFDIFPANMPSCESVQSTAASSGAAARDQANKSRYWQQCQHFTM